MKVYTSIVKNAAEDIAKIYSETYANLEENISELRKIFEEHFSRLRENVHLLIETDYVDKMHRDIYYHYYSTKLDEYPRNCIRVSLFNKPITEDIFLETTETKKVRDNNDFLGFYVFRPTFPNLIGRNVISPKALRKEYNNFKTCTTCFSTTANGVKFDVIGFPHTSQDGEMIKCAEVTIWELMEYFGNKYPEYSTVTPSKILNTLKNITFERQLPSRGLPVELLSYALKEFGFAPKIFSEEKYKADDFKKLFSCYVESGIPIVVCIEGDMGKSVHAILCTGHENEDFGNYIVYVKENLKKESNNVKIFDWDSLDKNFVFIDDNSPAYQIAPFNKPVNYIMDAKVIHFIVPLYTKVYLDAHEVKSQIKKIILERDLFYLAPDWDDNIIIRTFLTSGRSYKQYIVQNSKIHVNLKHIINKLNFPKFVWICELSHLELVNSQEINGLIILDATEPGITKHKSLILITNSTRVAYKENGKMIEENIGECEEFKDENGTIQKKCLPLQPFSRFESNIKAFN